METDNYPNNQDQIYDYMRGAAKYEDVLASFSNDEKKLQSNILNHYYLAPKNLHKAQLLLALLSILLSLAITVVDVGSDIGAMLMSLIIGGAISLPFWIIFLMTKKLDKFERNNLLFATGFLYSCLAALLFIFICLSLKIFGAVAIPVVILFFYYSELLKLNQLRQKLKSGK